MVGFPAKPSKPVEEELAVVDQELTKLKSFKDTLDFPSIDSFLNFDSCNWLGSNRNGEEFSIEDTDFDFFDFEMEIPQEGDDGYGEGKSLVDQLRTSASQSVEVKSELCGDVSEENAISSVRSEPEVCDGVAESVVKEAEPKPVESVSLACETMKSDEAEVKKVDEGLASCIEVGLEKVSLTMGDDENADGAKEEEANAAVSENQSSSSSSSGSDNSSSEEEKSDEEEEEDEKEKKSKDQMVLGREANLAGELEEGEIESVNEEHEGSEDDEDEDDDDDDDVNEMIAWSNDEDEELGLQTKEPIRSKNELKELPPVPAVDVTLEPHHAMLPVGVVLSLMSTQVIVEGMEQHSPLTEGSILWITERRTPLGLVDEIFGPVKCPYYIVRFNTESEVPEGISQGTHISFVADFAQHILNIKELQKKGYDASGDNDEEIPDEAEFSDDEKEAEFRRMQKMEKRGFTNDQKGGNIRNKKKKNRDHGRSESSYYPNRSDPQMGGPVSNHQPRPQMDSFPRPNGGPWRPQQNQFQFPSMPNQMGMPNLGPMQIPLMAMQNQNQMMFQPQFNGGQMPMPGGPGGINFFPGPPNCFNQQPFGMGRPQLPNELSFNPFASQGFQMQQPQPIMNPQFQMQPQFQPHPQFQMVNRPPPPPQSPVMQRQSEMRPQSQIPRSSTSPQPQLHQPQSQEFSSGSSSERGRGHRGGPGRGRGRGRFRRGGRGRG